MGFTAGEAQLEIGGEIKVGEQTGCRRRGCHGSEAEDSGSRPVPKRCHLPSAMFEYDLGAANG